MVKPSQVPAMVLAHQDYLRSERYRAFAKGFFKKILEGPVADLWVSTTCDRLNISGLFHVSESMTEVAKVAARQLHTVEKWGMEAFPARDGILVFEKPLQALDVYDRIMSIGAIQWMRGDDGTWWLTMYTPLSDTEDTYNRMSAAEGTLETLHRTTGEWCLTAYRQFSDGDLLEPWLDAWTEEHVTEWTKAWETYYDEKTEYIKELYEQIRPDSDVLPPNLPVYANVERILFAIFALMDQSITVLSEETDRKLARRNQHKTRRPPPMVTVIKLRREEHHGYREAQTGTWLTYRAVTRGHWRRQHYGPGGEHVHRIWISSYIRGPEGAPFHQPKRVSSLVR